MDQPYQIIFLPYLSKGKQKKGSYAETLSPLLSNLGSNACCFLVTTVVNKYSNDLGLTKHLTLTRIHTLPLECQSALGVESGAIPDSQMSASSQWDGNHAAKQGRLFFKSTTKASSWSAKTNNANQWLQVHLRVYTRVTRVASQGRHAVLQWVTKYKLQYSIDGNTFHYFREAGQSADKVKLTPGPQRQGSLFVFRVLLLLFFLHLFSQ